MTYRMQMRHMRSEGGEGKGALDISPIELLLFMGTWQIKKAENCQAICAGGVCFQVSIKLSAINNIKCLQLLTLARPSRNHISSFFFL